MVLIKHGDLKFIFTLENKNECQNTVAFNVKNSASGRMSSICLLVTLLGHSISTAQDDPFQCY